MKNCSWRLVYTVHLTKSKVLVYECIKRAALYLRADLVHLRGGKYSGHRAVHVAALLPLFLILEKRLFDRFDFAEVCSRPGITCGDSRVGVHGKWKIAMNQINLARADVVVHEQTVGSGVKRLASRTLIIAELFHNHRGVLRAKGFVGINVLKPIRGLGYRKWCSFRRQRRSWKGGSLFRCRSDGRCRGGGRISGSSRCRDGTSRRCDRGRGWGLVQRGQEQSP